MYNSSSDTCAAKSDYYYSLTIPPSQVVFVSDEHGLQTCWKTIAKVSTLCPTLEVSPLYSLSLSLSLSPPPLPSLPLSLSLSPSLPPSISQPNMIIGVDCEWRLPACNGGIERLALMQLAVSSSVFLLDMVHLPSAVPEKTLKEFMGYLFGSRNNLKLGRLAYQVDDLYLTCGLTTFT